MNDAQTAAPITVTPEEVEAVIAELEADRAGGAMLPTTRGIRIERARALISASAHRLTWIDATEDWACLTLARPGSVYPAL
jgi:hypothetical protein